MRDLEAGRVVLRGIGEDGLPFETRANLRTIIWNLGDTELQHRGEMNVFF
ncbi:MAG TPA: hypothetical protein VEK13_04625 [Thermoplasmata archaeon]|nr:hypothetical protein [Thermoplasmata archaeon]